MIVLSPSIALHLGPLGSFCFLILLSCLVVPCSLLNVLLCALGWPILEDNCKWSPLGSSVVRDTHLYLLTCLHCSFQIPGLEKEEGRERKGKCGGEESAELEHSVGGVEADTSLDKGRQHFGKHQEVLGQPFLCLEQPSPAQPDDRSGHSSGNRLLQKGYECFLIRHNCLLSSPILTCAGKGRPSGLSCILCKVVDGWSVT